LIARGIIAVFSGNYFSKKRKQNMSIFCKNKYEGRLNQQPLISDCFQGNGYYRTNKINMDKCKKSSFFAKKYRYITIIQKTFENYKKKAKIQETSGF